MSMTYLYEMFEHLLRLWMGRWCHIHIVTTTGISSDLSSTPPCALRPAPRRGLARCSPRPQPQRWACSGGPARTALITPARHRRLPSHASDRRRSWSLSPGVWPAVTLAYSTRHNGGGGRAAKPAPPPLPPTQLPGAAPLADPPLIGLQGSGLGRRARPRTGTTAPPDGEDFALHPAALIIGHAADHLGLA
jgi:hypothetical protein